MSQLYDIQLERPSGVYYAGETVNGHIYLTLPERALIKAIALESNGFAYSSWLKPQKQKASKKQQVAKPPLAFEKRADYFAKVDYFVGSEHALPQIIDAGTYRYDFSVQLPINCPSSYEGAHGHIRYTLQLMLYRSTDQAAEMAVMRTLQVLQRCDSSPGQLTSPCEVQSMEQTSKLKFWQRPLQLQLDIPRSGYEPGACISVHVKLDNPQQLKLKTLTYKLNLVSTYMGQHQSRPKRTEFKVERRYLVSTSHQLNAVPRHELLNFQHLQTLQVPQTPATLSADVCACLQLSYEVEVLVQTTSPERSILAQIPVIVTNPTPLQDCQVQQPMARTPFDPIGKGASSSPNQTPEHNSLAMSAPNLSQSMISLTSNFREAEFMVATNLNKKDKHAMSGENIDFRPRYLYYEMEHAETEKVL
ncbi:arrestin domain-containing protein 17 [Drosophila nasuta]|uniref:arrestin domain-containing protein 17 n=1 Tax=Drosophila nasuta TaxID=42062 RepID=UPI00295E69E1|nr:arrestin domain-containing protein 17 [Drosophila nasuta]